MPEEHTFRVPEQRKWMKIETTALVEGLQAELLVQLRVFLILRISFVGPLRRLGVGGRWGRAPACTRMSCSPRRTSPLPVSAPSRRAPLPCTGSTAPAAADPPCRPPQLPHATPGPPRTHAPTAALLLPSSRAGRGIVEIESHLTTKY